MLIQKVTDGSKIKAIYESSNILASSYDKTTKQLIITFKRGVQYRYFDVSFTDYSRFELAESQGAILNTHIKQYKTEKGDTVDSNLILEEIQKAKQNNLVQRQLEIISALDEIVTKYNQESILSESEIRATITKLENYLKDINV